MIVGAQPLCVLLDPRPTPAAAELNDAVLGNRVLGIEVTIPALAVRCELGNIDPQHTEGRADRAAIEEAMEFPLGLPYGLPYGAVMATIRADLDAVGAMAVILLRIRGGFTPRTRERVAAVAASDKFSRGGWPGPQPFDFSTPSDMEKSKLAAIAVAVGDHKVPFAERVETMVWWLRTGDEPAGYREQYEAEQAEMRRALESGAIKAETAADGRLATVVSNHRAAMAIGYRLAPVVVAENPGFRLGGGEPHRKLTVAQFAAGYVHLEAAKQELAALEPGWGGSPTIIGSPQGVGSTLTLEQVVEVVTRHLTK